MEELEEFSEDDKIEYVLEVDSKSNDYSKESDDLLEDSNIDFPPEVDSNAKDYIKRILPNYKTKILSYDENTTTLTFLLAAKSADEINAWVNDFQEKNLVSYSKKSTEKCSGRYLLLKHRLKCVHNTVCKRVYDPSSKNRTRNTNCPSILTISLFPIKKRYKGKDQNQAPIPEMPCKIVLIASHNHSLGTVDSLRFRQVGEDTKNKLLDLYARGHSAGSALETLKMDIQLNFIDNYHKILADRKFCPDYMYCYHLFKNEFEKKYGLQDFDFKGQDFLQEMLEKYNLENADFDCAKMIFDDSNYLICLCPPLIKRNHRYLKAASELVYFDSSGTFGHNSCRLLTLLTHSECGGLPLGFMITSSKSTDLVTNGLRLLQQMVGDQMFGGNPDGPLVFMVNDLIADKIAIQKVFHASKCLLSTSNVLHTVWAWLTKSKNAIPDEKQYDFYQLFKEIACAKTIPECFEKYNKAILSVNEFQIYVEYINDYWNRKEDWALCYRSDFLIRGDYTDISSETTIRIINKKIFNRVKVFNVVQMVDFIMTKCMLIYERRLLDAANNRLKENILNDVAKAPEGLLERAENLCSGITLVPSEAEDDLFYMVHSDILVCSCFRLNVSLYCKHIEWVCWVLNSEEYKKSITNKEDRKTFFIIATGVEPPYEWLASLYGINDHTYADYTKCIAGEGDTLPTISDVIFFEAKDDPNLTTIIKQGQEDIREIVEFLTKALETSPQEIQPSLKVMKNNLQQLKTSSEIASALAAFGSESP